MFTNVVTIATPHTLLWTVMSKQVILRDFTIQFFICDILETKVYNASDK